MNLLIIGCGGHGRCCLDIALSMNKYDEICFLDDTHTNKSIQHHKVIGKTSDLKQFSKNFEEIFIALGNNIIRDSLTILAKKAGYKIATIIHSSAYIANTAKIDEGSVIFPFVSIENSAEIGKGSIICSNTVINHDARVGEFSLIYANSTIRAAAKIGKKVRIGSNCCIGYGQFIEDTSDLQDGTVV